MKAVKITRDVENVKCPNCGFGLELMQPNGEAMGEYEHGATVLPITRLHFISSDSDSKYHKDGQIYFCSECQELIFVYVEEDYRKCKNCPHCGDVEHEFTEAHTKKTVLATGCKWFNTVFGKTNWLGYVDLSKKITYLNCPACKNIDAPLHEIDPNMKCFLCKYYEEKDELVYGGKYEKRINCWYPMPYQISESLSIENKKHVCCNFEPSYEKYKAYRASFEDLLIVPDDMISIPEFDERILKETENA